MYGLVTGGALAINGWLGKGIISMCRRLLTLRSSRRGMVPQRGTRQTWSARYRTRDGRGHRGVYDVPMFSQI